MSEDIISKMTERVKSKDTKNRKGQNGADTPYSNACVLKLLNLKT